MTIAMSRPITCSFVTQSRSACRPQALSLADFMALGTARLATGLAAQHRFRFGDMLHFNSHHGET